VQADSSILYNGIAGSIHKISAMILQKDSNNGWTFWYVIRDNHLISIDQIRQDYINTYFKSAKKLDEIPFEIDKVCEPKNNFLYDNDEL